MRIKLRNIQLQKQKAQNTRMHMFICNYIHLSKNTLLESSIVNYQQVKIFHEFFRSTDYIFLFKIIKKSLDCLKK